MGLLSAAQSASSATAGLVSMASGRFYPSLSLPTETATNLRNKRALISGGNSGIGYETALLLAKHGAEVVILCRSASKAEAACEAIKNAIGDEGEKRARVEYEVVDFASLKSVREFVERWKAKSAEDQRIDILVNNAGLPTPSKVTTSEGFELGYVTNHLSHFLLTLLLLPHFPASGSGRILNVSSLALYASDALRPGRKQGNSPDRLDVVEEGANVPRWTIWTLYARTKAMQVVATLEMQKRLKDRVTVNALHPGLVQTGIWQRSLPLQSIIQRPLNAFVSLTGIAPGQSAILVASLASSEDAAVKEGGKFFDRSGYKWLPSWMRDEKRREALWEGWIQDADARAIDIQPST